MLFWNSSKKKRKNQKPDNLGWLSDDSGQDLEGWNHLPEKFKKAGNIFRSNI